MAILVAAIVLAACSGQSEVKAVQVISASGQCTPQSILLRKDVTYRVSFLNQDAGGDRWDLFLRVPVRERPETPDEEPTLHLSSRAQQSVSGQITPTRSGQYSYTCITETRNLIVRSGTISVVD